MCAGPVEEVVKFPAKAINNIVKDVTGVTEKREQIKKFTQQQAEVETLANKNQGIIDANEQAMLTLGAEADAANQAAAAAAAETISNIRQVVDEGVIKNPPIQEVIVGPSAAQIAARNAAIQRRNAAISAASSAAKTSQGVINKQKKKRKGLKISPKDAYAKGTRSPGSTSASLKIGSQGTSPGTGTNLPV